MNIKNSQIRAQARHLLDENIFGKDWLKSIILNLIRIAVVAITGGLLYSLSNAFFAPFVVKQVGYLTNNEAIIVVVMVIFEIFEYLMLNILIGPLSVGMASVHLDLVRGEGKIKIKNFFHGFKELFDNFQIGFMYMLHILLWTLVFIIPGIYVSYSYALAFYVKKDNPDYRWQQCFDESERLMEGNRFRLFKLQLSFIGWILLGGLAFFGLGMLWVTPYQEVSTAIFYETLKHEKGTNQVSFDPKQKKGETPIIVDLTHKKGLFKKSIKRARLNKDK